ncbi:MAG TPA: hypothetical protein VGP95_14090 [Gemmatimonadaceae bacterium]|jgi:hypothetical protein|nr:hypothetical protein [Gemmatimonadaceae bacterium]
MSETPAPTVTYYAISLFSSRTFWLSTASFLVMVLSATDVITLFPLKALPFISAAVSVLTVWLRFVTVRPVALIAPGTTLPIQVAKLDPPTAAPMVGD